MNQWIYAVLTLLLVGIMVAVAWLLPAQAQGARWTWAWVINLVVLFGVLGCVSMSVGARTGFWAMFVDNRNMVSLSQFQIVLWTLVVVSAFWTIGIARVRDSGKNASDYVCQPPVSQGEQQPAEAEQPPCAAPLDLKLPEILWALMGISITSAVASPLIKQEKAQRTSQSGGQQRKEDALEATLATRAYEPLRGEFANRGALAVRNPDKSPKFSDMFRGETVDNVVYVDIAKVQNFFFTIVALVTYGAALAAAMGGAASIGDLIAFPDVSEGLLAILGISHAGYLVKKAATT